MMDLDGVYGVSDAVVARAIAGRLVIVPVRAGVGDPDDELYVLNDTGAAVWAKLDGQRSVQAIVGELAREYHAEEDVVGRDVLRLVEDLLERRILVGMQTEGPHAAPAPDGNP